MPITRWIAMRQARDALYAGRLDAARRHLAPHLRDGRRTSTGIGRELAKAYRDRGEKALRAEHPESAWKDLLTAEELPHAAADLAPLRATLTKLGLAECRAALAAGRATFVLERIAALKRRRASHPEFDPLELAATNALRAREQADRGEFEAAAAADPRGRTEFARRAEVLRAALPLLAESLATRHWTEAVRHATTVLGVAPNHREARAAKARAWDAVQPINLVAAERNEGEPVLRLPPGGGGRSERSEEREGGTNGQAPPTLFASRIDLPLRGGGEKDFPPPDSLRESTFPTRGEVESPAVVAELLRASPPVIPRRFLLWIDGVGGYLVCTGARVAFGQAAHRGPVDVPLFADVSRLHAEIRRDGEGYVLESGHNVAVNGTPAPRVFLKPDDRITFGATCQLLFQQPVPISPTAKLELVSGHRLPVAVDAVWLMAENLVLGPAAPAHVVVPDLPGPAVFYRCKEGLGFRCAGAFRVDGEPHDGKAVLRVPCQVTADHLSFALEAIRTV